MPATTAPVMYIARALRQYSFQTRQRVLSLLIATNAETHREFTQNCAIAIMASIHTNAILVAISREPLVEPKTIATAAQVAKTDIAVIKIFITTVLTRMGT